MTCARARDYAGAIGYLDQALALNPRHYWSHLQRGLCHQERNEPVLAAADFGACVGLEPGFAWGYFNRAYALARCGKKAEALGDYTSALRCDGRLLSAYLNRGLLRLEAGDAESALADFRQALEGGRDDAALHSGRGVSLERLGRHREADEAFEAARSRAAKGPRPLRARLLWVYGFAVADRLPERSRAAFAAVLDEQPKHPQALYGLAMLLDRAGKSAEALPYFTKALEAAPELTEARRFRAVALARLGQFREADVEIQRCLDREPRSGATRYAAACVRALAAHADERAAAGAIEFLRQAFALGHGRDKAAHDPDLAGIRASPEFRRLVPAAQAGSARPQP
jgi:tetratricopeptide (TPR) repeat protein